MKPHNQYHNVTKDWIELVDKLFLELEGALRYSKMQEELIKLQERTIEKYEEMLRIRKV